MTSTPFSRAAGSAVPSLADLLDQIAKEGSLSSRQRQEERSALRCLGRAIGRRLEEIPAHPRLLQERLVKLTPAMAGVSPGRWSNVVSLTRAVLKRAGLTSIPGRSTEPLTPEWQELFRWLNDRRMREGLSRFARHCGAHNIRPTDVDEKVAGEFLAAMEHEAVIRKPRQVYRTMCISWNKARAIIAEWPLGELPIPQYKETYSLEWSAFPRSLRDDIAAYFDRLAGKDLLAELDFRPLRPASIKTYDLLLREYLSALVHRDRDPQNLRSLADIVPVEIVKDGLRFFIERGGGNKTKQAYNIARMLSAIAKHWVRLDRDELGSLSAVCRRLNPGKGGLTDKNRDRLRQFDDPVHVKALLTLPQRILARQKKRPSPCRADALQVQGALAVELLMMIPMRIKNLAGLNLDSHILRTRARGRGVVHLVVPSEEVKNNTAIEAELPPETVELLDLYLERYRPLLMQQPSSWLFPNQSNGHKTPRTLGEQIQKLVRREGGLEVNPHLFRHIAAKHYLDAHVGDYGVIRLVHGHKSVETTQRYYCGTETAAAMRHFDDHVLGLRAPNSGLSARHRRKPR